MHKGHIKLHRSIQDWEWIDDHNTTRTFLFLLLLANTKEKQQKGYIIKSGSLLTKLKTLESIIGLTQKELKQSIINLVDCKFIRVNKYKKDIIISINSFRKYQSEDELAASGKSKIIDYTDLSTEQKQEFDAFWKLYDYKINRPKCVQKYFALDKSERVVLMQALPKYIKNSVKVSQMHDPRILRKHPQTYLNNKSWNDEVVEVILADNRDDYDSLLS